MIDKFYKPKIVKISTETEKGTGEERRQGRMRTKESEKVEGRVRIEKEVEKREREERVGDNGLKRPSIGHCMTHLSVKMYGI